MTAAVGGNPQSLAIDDATHTVYVANGDDSTVSVINAATCNRHVAAGCATMAPTVAVGGGPGSPVLDHQTHTLYVANYNDGTVSVVNAATCNAEMTAGCGQTAPAVTVGNSPTELALDQKTHTLYAENFGDGTVSVVNTAHCNAAEHSGCSQTPHSISFGKVQPQGLSYDAHTQTLFVANLAVSATHPNKPNEPDTISLVNTARCNAEVITHCAPVAHMIKVGKATTDQNVAFALDPLTKTLYVTNYIANTLSLIDTKSCTAAHSTRCPSRAPVVPSAGPGGNTDITIDAHTRTLYEIENDNNKVYAVALASCGAVHIRGCSHPVGDLRAGVNAQYAQVDPKTQTLYEINSAFDGDVSVMNAATCNAGKIVGCTLYPQTVAVGSDPSGIAINPVTHTVYVTNSSANTVSVIDASRCDAASYRKCAVTSPTIAVGADPTGVAVNPLTNTVYVTNQGQEPADGTVSVIDGATCDAGATDGCSQQPPAVTVGVDPIPVAVDPDTDTAYVGNNGDGTVSMIDTQTCDSAHIAGCGHAAPTVKVGSSPLWITDNPAAHTAYVVNNGDDTVSVINTATCDSTVVTSCNSSQPTVAAGNGPAAASLDTATGTLYVADANTRSVAILDATTCQSTDTSGCGQTPTSIPVGTFPYSLVDDLATHTLYVGDYVDGAVSEINTANCNHAALQTSCRHEAPSFSVGNGPSAIAIDPSRHTVYVVDGEQPGLDDSLSMLRTS